MSYADDTFSVRKPDGTFYRYDVHRKMITHLSRDGSDVLAKTKAENSDAASPKASAGEIEGLKDSMFVVSAASSDSDLPKVRFQKVAVLQGTTCLFRCSV